MLVTSLNFRSERTDHQDYGRTKNDGLGFHSEVPTSGGSELVTGIDRNPVYAGTPMEDQDSVTVRLYLRTIRGEDIAGDDAITLQEDLSRMDSEKLLELVQTVASRGSKGIVKRVQGEELTPEEEWMADEMGEQLSWAWQKPKNQEHRRETVKEALIATRRNAAESLAKGSEFADQFAELYIQAMKRLEEIEPDLAAEIEDEE